TDSSGLAATIYEGSIMAAQDVNANALQFLYLRQEDLDARAVSDRVPDAFDRLEELAEGISTEELERILGQEQLAEAIREAEATAAEMWARADALWAQAQAQAEALWVESARLKDIADENAAEAARRAAELQAQADALRVFAEDTRLYAEGLRDEAWAS